MKKILLVILIILTSYHQVEGRMVRPDEQISKDCKEVLEQ